jgi:hypothetical protein
MPVDRRIREGLHGDARAFEPATDGLLDAVTGRGRRRRVRRRFGQAGAACLLALLALGGGWMLLAGRTPATPAAGAAWLQGSWAGPMRTADQLRAAVEAGGGDPRCADGFAPATGAVAYTLVVEGEHYSVLASTDGKAGVEDGRGVVEMTAGGNLRFVETDDLTSATFEVSVTDDRLTMRLVDIEPGEDTACEVTAEAIAQFEAGLVRA